MGLTGELAAAQWGHRSRRHRCNAGGRQGSRCRLRLWVSWSGCWTHQDVSCGSRAHAGGMRHRRLGGRWLMELGLGGKPVLERLRRTKVRSENEIKKRCRQKVTVKYRSKSAIYHVVESKTSGSECRAYQSVKAGADVKMSCWRERGGCCSQYKRYKQHKNSHTKGPSHATMI